MCGSWQAQGKDCAKILLNVHNGLVGFYADFAATVANRHFDVICLCGA
jgi:hypothetical protein